MAYPIPTPTKFNPYPDMTGGTGFVPMLQEDLHQFEKQGLTGMAGGVQDGGMSGNAAQFLQQMMSNPQATASNFTNPMATQYMTQAGDYTARGAAPIAFDEVQAAANPYASALKNRLTQEGERARAAILANQGMRGARSFGDTAQGVRQGMLDQEMLSKSSDIDYQTFGDARSFLERMRDRTMQAGGQFGNLGTAAQGITNSAFANAGNAGAQGMDAAARLADMRRTANSDMVNAGGYIRDYNQGVNNLISANMTNEMNDPLNKVNTALGWLQNFMSNTSSTKQSGGIGPLVSAVAGAGMGMGMGGGSSLPWQAAGNIKPEWMGGGFY